MEIRQSVQDCKVLERVTYLLAKLARSGVDVSTSGAAKPFVALSGDP